MVITYIGDVIWDHGLKKVEKDYYIRIYFTGNMNNRAFVNEKWPPVVYQVIRRIRRFDHTSCFTSVLLCTMHRLQKTNIFDRRNNPIFLKFTRRSVMLLKELLYVDTFFFSYSIYSLMIIS